MQRRIATLLCLLIVLAPVILFAQDVYVTKQGTKYHSQDCPFIAKRQTEKINEEEAILRGLSPCSRCLGKKITKANNPKPNNPGEEDLVYATANGKRYHRKDCYLIKNKNTQAIPLSEAEAKGLTPCSRCFRAQADEE